MQKNEFESALQQFISLSERIGAASPYWCQGDSGHLSVKYDAAGKQRMVVKKPMVRLADISTDSGWLDEAIPFWQAQTKHTTNEWSDSLHASIHAILLSKIVVELTSLAALLMAHEHQDDMNVSCWLAERLRSEVAIVQYPRNAEGLLKAVSAHSKTGAIVIANYGVILHGSSEGILDRWHEVEREFCERLGYLRLLRQLGGVKPGDLGELPTPKRNYLGGPVREKSIPSSALVEAAVASRAGKRAGERQFFLQSTDPDLADLWQAHQILYAECPALRELPTSAVGSFVHRGRIPLEDEMAFRRR